jgi:hypothetical protein
MLIELRVNSRVVADPSITRIWWVVTGPWLLVRLAFECEVLGKQLL